MAHWLLRAAEMHPDRVAVEGPERTLTYAELSAAAIVTAGALGRLGPGPRVALALADPVEFVIALHGCLLARKAAVPVDLRLSEQERGRRLAGAGAIVSEPLRGLSSTVPLSHTGDPAVAVVHTSGTTAAPKQVELTSSNFQASALGSAVALGLDPAERWLCPMPLTHVGGLSIPIRSAIYATTALVHGRFETEPVLNQLMDPGARVTIVSLVPTMLARLLEAGLEHPPTLRWALLGGGPIPPPLLARAQAAGVSVAPTYGMTETCSQIATFGFPLHGAEVSLEGPGTEIRVRGPMVASGSLAQDGWLHTGDLGAFDSRGRLTITGRASDTVVTGGENVAPAEVEARLLEHPAVADAGVFGRPDPEWGEAVVAAVALHDGSSVAPEELRSFCAQRLAGYKVPKRIEFVKTLPRTESGKLLRRDLR